MRACSYCHQLLSDGELVCPRDGATGSEVQVARVPGQLHARFPAIEPFARGATGTLFLAVQAQSGYRGLLKILSPEVAASPAERSRLKRELRKQTALTNNSLARIIDGGEIGPEFWLFRDFVQGESLALHLRKQGPLPVPEALAIAAQVASALDEVHRQGLLHRDIKPGHILLTKRVDAVPLVTVIDTGVAARLPAHSVLELLGTPAYIAPEVLAGKPASFRSDVYALGCVLYEMLTGAPPFTADTVDGVLAAHRDTEAREVEVDLPLPVRALLTSLLAKEPRRRPFSAQQVRRTLDPHLPATTPEPSSGTRTLAGNVAAPRPSTPPSVAPLGPGTPPPPGVSATRSSTPKMPAVSATRSSTLKMPAVRTAPPVPSAPGARPDENTEEIDLAAVEAGIAASADLTQELRSQELELATQPEPPSQDVPVVVAAEPSFRASAVEDPSAALEAASSEETEPVAPAPEPVHSAAIEAAKVSEPAVVPDELAASAPASQVQSPSTRPARAAVDFDVESLFDDDLASAPKPIVTPPAPALGSVPPAPLPARSSLPAAPLPVRSSLPAAPLPVRSSLPAAPPPAFASSGSAPAAPRTRAAALGSPPPPHEQPEAMVAEEGIVVVPRPSGRPGGKRPWPLIVAAAAMALLALAFGLRSGGREHAHETTGAGAAAATPPTAAEPGAKPSAARPSVAEPSAVKAPDAPSQAAGAERDQATAAAPGAQTGSAQNAPSQAAASAAPLGSAPSRAQPSAAASEANRAPTTTSAGAAPAAPSRAAGEAAPAGEAAAPEAQQPTAAKSQAKGARASAPVPYHPPPPAEPGIDYRAKARELFQAGKYREAAQAYERAAQQTPADASAFAGLGGSWFLAGEPDKSILAYQRAVQLKPDVSAFHTALGRAYAQKGDRGRASAAFRKALDLDPNNQAAKALLAGLGK